MKSRIGWLLAIASSAAIYSLTLASTEPIDLATGALIGALVAWLIDSYMRGSYIQTARSLPPVWHRLVWLPIFLLAVLRDVISGTLLVARYSLGFRTVDHQGIVAIPVGDRSNAGVAVSAWATTLSPGTALVDVDWEAGQMLIHVIDASNPDEIRNAMQTFYERYQRHVFP